MCVCVCVCEDEYSRNSHLQYINLANHSPCDVNKKKADFQEDDDHKLQIFAYLHIGVTTLSITIFTYGTASFTEIKILCVSGTLKAMDRLTSRF